MEQQDSRSIPSARWWRIIPPAILVYIFSFMDRTNIGFAMAGGMNESLSMTASMSGLAAGIFFVGYVLLQAPAGHWAEHRSAKQFIGLSILVWGGLSILCGFVQTSTQLLVVRFLIGVAEGGVWPAMLVILSHWFPNEERGRANAYFIMNIAIASIITGPLSGWIISSFGWRWVFIGEGLLSLLLILVWYPLISDTPAKAKWISKEEREYIETRLAAEQSSLKTDAPVSYGVLLRDWKLWKLILLYFFYQVGIYGFAMWLPTLLKELTATGMTGIGFLSMFPYIAMIAGLYGFAQLSDRSGNRRRYTALPILGFAVCFLLSTLLKDQIWVSFGFLVACGLFMQSASSIFWTIPPIMFPAQVAGGARGIINAIGNLGGFIGPFAVGWFRTSFNSYDAGIYFLVMMLGVGFLLAISLPRETAGRRKPVLQTA
ncbi:MFS transporter [Rhodovastum atsumiense]|uniref:MFS transporter n=1 Tax=Rhodovastum atsumiense TaxID=504468 RepID=A0A5M6IPS3_9PROT|nr:MFS transporter [Rhodovastum atsumiense]KAA5610282.1 MFS transporter [Rhodovastum atsumiense]CAH2602231.1 MFS transporter [Rhodovastum atsumiense]